MKIAVSDDNVEYLELLTIQIRRQLATKPLLHKAVQSFSPGDLLTMLERHQFDYSIVFLDIKMGRYDGIRLAKMINKTSPRCQIIFISNYLELATKVYDVDHTYFILKSELKERLPLALEKAIEISSSNNSKPYLEIISQSRKIFLAEQDISYIEVNGRRLTIHTTAGEYCCNRSLTGIHAELPEFIRIHHSFLVNPAYIRSLTGTSCLLSTQECLPVSRTYYKKTKESYSRYLASLL